MRRALAACAVLALGCGRIGFADRSDGDGGAGDGALAIDGSPQADDDNDGVANAIDLCDGDDAIDANGNGIADACDPCLASTACMELGVPDGNEASWAERVYLVGTNAVRADPIGFRTRYMQFSDGTGAMVFSTDSNPRPPFQFGLSAAQGARFHAENRMGCAFGPIANAGELCDGTPFSTWLANYSGAGSLLVTPVQRTWVREDAFWMVAADVCAFIPFTGYTLGACQSDSTFSRQIMVFNTSDKQMGPGWAKDANGTRYEIDAAWMAAAPPESFPVPSGAHFFDPGASTLTFALNYELAAPARTMFVDIDGTRFPLTTALGTNVRGMATAEIAFGTGCRSYHFVLIDSTGVVWRYPGVGELRTLHDGGCLQDYLP